MMMNKSSFRMLVVLVLVLVICRCVLGDDWPQWRGPERNGVWKEDGIIDSFKNGKADILWRAKVSNGYSGPTVARTRVFLTDRLTKPSQIERVLCFSAQTGDHIWTKSYPCSYKIGYRDGPRAAVTIDGNRAYSLGAMGHLHCLNVKDGQIIWAKNLNDEYEIRMPIWGIACSVLIEDDLAIVIIGGKGEAGVVAFDKNTGAEKWKAIDDTAGYSAPVVITQAKKTVLVCWMSSRVVGLDPATGRLYWEYPFEPVQTIMNIADPVYDGKHLFISAFFDGSLLLELKPDELTAQKVWQRRGRNERETDALHCCISTPIIEGDFIYGVDSYGQLRCLDLMTGDRVWENLDAVPKERWANIHMVRNGDKVWMFNEKGELIISKLSPKGFTEISRARVIDPTEGQLGRGVTWSHPAFAHKKAYVRNDNELVCIDLEKK